MALIRADAGFAGADWEDQVHARFGWPVEIIRKPKDQVGLAVLPRRSMGDRTNLWVLGARSPLEQG